MDARLVILLVILASGCSSTRSTLLHRGECDQSWETERYLNGVPITVQVPSHIKVDVIEHHYLGLVPTEKKDENGDTINEPGWLTREMIGVPARTVNTSLLKTAQIFTIDPKRPAAGTIDSTIDFGGVNGQYLDQVAYKVDDQTIEAITGLLGKVAKKGLIGTPTSGGAPGSTDDYLRTFDNVVASGIFSLDAPNVELEIAQFLDTHLNNCHTCNVVPDGVVEPKRLSPMVEDPCVHGELGSNCPHCNAN